MCVCVCVCVALSPPPVGRDGNMRASVMQAGELCGEDHAEDCCFQDCQAVQGRCPVPQGATLPCGGPGRGVCLAASGQCDWYATRLLLWAVLLVSNASYILLLGHAAAFSFVNKGYTGRDCSRCAAGWSRTTSGECQYNVRV